MKHEKKKNHIDSAEIMAGLEEILARMEEEKNVKAICTIHGAMQHIEDLEERIAIILEGELFCPMCGKKLDVK